MKNVDNYQKQVIKTFFKNGQLLKIPTQNRKKDVVLQKISTKFIKDQLYSEAQVNEILKKIYPQFEELKVLLLGSRFMKKTNDLYQLTY